MSTTNALAYNSSLAVEMYVTNMKVHLCMHNTCSIDCRPVLVARQLLRQCIRDV